MLHMIDMWMTLFTWMSMWHVADWEPVWYVLSWVSYAITLWIIWLCQMTVIGRVMYENLPIELHSAYSLHTVMCSEAMQSSQKVHSFHTCIWIYDCVKIYLLLNKSCKRRWYTYLKMNLNMWLKRRARMMAACDMDINTLDSETKRGGLLVCVTSPTPRAL